MNSSKHSPCAASLQSPEYVFYLSHSLPLRHREGEVLELWKLHTLLKEQNHVLHMTFYFPNKRNYETVG